MIDIRIDKLVKVETENSQVRGTVNVVWNVMQGEKRIAMARKFPISNKYEIGFNGTAINISVLDIPTIKQAIENEILEKNNREKYLWDMRKRLEMDRDKVEFDCTKGIIDIELEEIQNERDGILDWLDRALTIVGL